MLKEPMKASELLRLAAERIFIQTSDHGCVAIEVIVDSISDRPRNWMGRAWSNDYELYTLAVHVYYHLMRPYEDEISGYWFTASNTGEYFALYRHEKYWPISCVGPQGNDEYLQEQREHRVIALLLAADIAESEGN